MPKKYDILLKATIEIGGEFEANTADEARAAAEAEFRTAGEISDLNFERCIFLDEADPEDLPAEAYDPQPGA